MLQSLAATDRRAMGNDACFVTLTYPEHYPESPARCKQQLEAWRKRLHRRHPRAWFYWKLEYQKRGAPHFHLLVFGVGTETVEWWHDQWAEVVKSNDYHHWSYGTDVKRLHSWKEAGAYCAKYAAKVDESTAGPDSGRFWGIGTRANRVQNMHAVKITDDEFYRLRRIFKRLIGARAGFYPKSDARSGVWVRCTNQTAKMALRLSRSAIPPFRPPPIGVEVSQHALDDSYGCGTSPSNTYGRVAYTRSTTVRNANKPTLRLFSQADLQRARSAQLAP